ncbi:MAG: hypothetical protein ABJA57_09395 [Ginsengibacter sp.]
MRHCKNLCGCVLIFIVFICLPYVSAAQTDSTPKRKTFDEYMTTRKGLFGRIAKVLMTDTTDNDHVTELQRNDIRFQRYHGKFIRSILFRRLNFGVPITDTSAPAHSALTKLANSVHRKTLERVIRNNLFFKEKDTVQPYLMADNERYLRDLPYIQDAKISVIRLYDTPDSVDVIVRTKDVLSIGVEFSSVDLNNTAVALTEENFAGHGDKIAFKTLFDNSRARKFGYGFDYIRRNIAGSFIDGYIGYENFNKDINGNKQEDAYYVKLIRPLANSYMRWTYSVEASRHETKNMYLDDSVYNSDYRYSYNTYDVWAGLNVDASFLDKYIRGQRLRGLIGLRLLSQKFDALPASFSNAYDSRFADISGVLATVSVFAQDFYKIQYIYGFGRNEDIPEGIDVGFTTGFTRKNNENRPYLGLKFQRYYFTNRQRYLNFTARVEGSIYKKNFQDVTTLLNVDFFNHLKNLGRWKQRTFLSAGIAWQVNRALNDPLFLESKFGLPEFRDEYMRGFIRTIVKTESVFFSPLSIAFFRFAPFVFYNGSIFTPTHTTFDHSKLYSSIGAGLRTRNESLIFGTLEIRAFYFPGRNPGYQNFRIQFNSNLKFKFDNQLIGRPDFIQFN